MQLSVAISIAFLILLQASNVDGQCALFENDGSGGKGPAIAPPTSSPFGFTITDAPPAPSEITCLNFISTDLDSCGGKVIEDCDSVVCDAVPGRSVCFGTTDKTVINGAKDISCNERLTCNTIEAFDIQAGGSAVCGVGDQACERAEFVAIDQDDATFDLLCTAQDGVVAPCSGVKTNGASRIECITEEQTDATCETCTACVGGLFSNMRLDAEILCRGQDACRGATMGTILFDSTEDILSKSFDVSCEGDEACKDAQINAREGSVVCKDGTNGGSEACRGDTLQGNTGGIMGIKAKCLICVEDGGCGSGCEFTQFDPTIDNDTEACPTDGGVLGECDDDEICEAFLDKTGCTEEEICLILGGGDACAANNTVEELCAAGRDPSPCQIVDAIVEKETALSEQIDDLNQTVSDNQDTLLEAIRVQQETLLEAIRIQNETIASQGVEIEALKERIVALEEIVGDGPVYPPSEKPKSKSKEKSSKSGMMGRYNARTSFVRSGDY